MKEVKVTVENGTQILEIREGAALPLKEPKIVDIKGTLTAPSIFYSKRKSTFEPLSAHVIYSREKGYLRLVINEASAYAGTIEGKIEINPLIKQIGINEPNRLFSIGELIKILRPLSYIFESKEEHREFIEGLQTFKASINTVIEKANDRKGNAQSSYKVSTDSQIPTAFKLKLPIIIGQEPKTFTVDMPYEIEGNSMTFLLESSTLMATIKEDTDTLFFTEIDKFPELICIEQ